MQLDFFYHNRTPSYASMSTISGHEMQKENKSKNTPQASVLQLTDKIKLAVMKVKLMREEVLRISHQMPTQQT